MPRVLMINGVEYETGAEISHLLDRNEDDVLTRIREHDERGYDIGDDRLAPARGLMWAFGMELLLAVVVAWIVWYSAS